MPTDFNLADALKALSSSYRESSIYPGISQAILSAPIQYNYDTSPWEKFGTTIAKGLLGGAVGGYGAQQAQEYDAATKSALMEALAGKAIAANDSLEDSDIKSIQGIADLWRQEEAQQERESQRDVDKALKIASGTAIAQEKAKNPYLAAKIDEAFGIFKPDSTVGSGSDKEGLVKQLSPEEEALFDPLVKAKAEKQKEEQNYLNQAQEFVTQRDPAAKAYLDLGPALDTLVREVGNTSAASDFITLTTAAKAVDPVGAINEGAVESASTAVPFLERRLGSLKEYFGADGLLTPEGKIKLISAVNSRVAPFGEAYSSIVAQQKSNLEKLGVDPSKLIVRNYQPLDISALKQKYMPTVAVADPKAQMAAEYRALKKELGEGVAQGMMKQKYPGVFN